MSSAVDAIVHAESMIGFARVALLECGHVADNAIARYDRRWTCAAEVVALATTLEQAETAAADALTVAAAGVQACASSSSASAADAAASSSVASSLRPTSSPIVLTPAAAGEAVPCLSIPYAVSLATFVEAARQAVAKSAAAVAACATAASSAIGSFAPCRTRVPRYHGPGLSRADGGRLHRQRTHAETLGDTASDYDPTAYVPSAAQLEAVQSQLGTALSPSQLSSVVTTYTGLSGAQQSSILSIAQSVRQGQVPSWTTVAPLVAGGLALFGVSAPIVAVVAAAIPLVSAILSALGIGPGSQKCNWVVGGTCFGGQIPYGPSDPLWKTFADFWSQSPTEAAGAFPEYQLTIGCELVALDATIATMAPPSGSPTLTATPVGKGGPSTLSTTSIVIGAQGIGGNPAPPAPPAPPSIPQAPAPPAIHGDPGMLNVLLFLRGFYTAWQLNAEQSINGHPAASDANLLQQWVTSWNATHSGYEQFTFQPTTMTMADILSTPDCYITPGVDFEDPNLPTFVSLLLAGQIDGVDQPPLTINIGGEIGAAGTGTGTSTSGLGTAALVVGGAGLAGAIGWALLKDRLGGLAGGRR